MYKGYEVLDAPLVSASWSRNSAAGLPDESGGQRVKRALRLALLWFSAWPAWHRPKTGITNQFPG